jgi:hypothetical protein
LRRDACLLPSDNRLSNSYVGGTMEGSLGNPPIKIRRSTTPLQLAVITCAALEVFLFFGAGNNQRFLGLAIGLAVTVPILTLAGFLHVSSELTLDATGITQRVGFSRRTCRWSDASNFRRHMSSRGFDYVDFDYAGSDAGWVSIYNRKTGMIWAGWELDVFKLSSLLNKAREKWGPPPSVSEPLARSPEPEAAM